jgi:hypothetical protein
MQKKMKTERFLWVDELEKTRGDGSIDEPVNQRRRWSKRNGSKCKMVQNVVARLNAYPKCDPTFLFRLSNE